MSILGFIGFVNQGFDKNNAKKQGNAFYRNAQDH